MICPRCHNTLQVTYVGLSHGNLELDACPACQGMWFDARELTTLLRIPNLDLFAHDSPLFHDQPNETLRVCPRDKHKLIARTLRGNEVGRPLEIDCCRFCEGVWLDGGELKQIAELVRQKRLAAFLEDPEARGVSVGIWIFMLLTQLPIERWNPTLRKPWVTRALVALCCLCFVLQFRLPDMGVESLGLLPADLFAGKWYTLLSYQFLHGGLLHLAGNMYFLWIFGDNVEDRLGHTRYIFLYLLSGVSAGLAHALLSPDGLPVVGASGAISGVMAAYAVLFPRTHLISLILFFRVRWRSWAYLLMWLGLQVIGVVRHEPQVAWWAHIGGFIVGGLAAYQQRRVRH